MLSTKPLFKRMKDFEWSTKDLLFSVILAIIPSVGLYMILSVSMNDPQIWSLWMGLIGFTVVFYRPDGLKSKVGATLFYLSIEAFIAPIAVLAFGVAYTAEQTGVFAQTGALIGSGIIFIITWFAAWMVGLVLYLLSRRFET